MYEKDEGVLTQINENGVMSCGDNFEDQDCSEVKNGQGKSYHKNGLMKYDGNWKDDKYDGHGKYYRGNGQIQYDGNWIDSKPTGQGKYYEKNGQMKYNGNWKDGNYDGQGKSYREND